MKEQIARFLQDENGTAAIEYSLIAALIAVPLIAGARNAGLAIAAVFNEIADAMRH